MPAKPRAEPPRIIPTDGIYISPVTVTIEADRRDMVFYTLDGTEPTKKNGIRYTGPFILEAGS